MEIIILGSGTGIPSRMRGAPGLLIKIGQTPLLFDSGDGTLTRLLQVGVNPLELDYLFYTHHHTDHVADLAPLLHAAVISFREKPLWIAGPRRVQRFYEGLLAIQPSLRPHTFQVNFREVRRSRLTYPDWVITTAPTGHTSDSVGYRVEAEGTAVVYSGDAIYVESLVELAKDADILILECSYPDEKAVEGHLTPTLAGRIAREANTKRLLLTHLYPPCDEADVSGQCQRIYDGQVIVARDLMRLRLKKKGVPPEVPLEKVSAERHEGNEDER